MALDPVMVATSGDRLIDDHAIQAVRDLMPLASVITPNLAEAAALLTPGPRTRCPTCRLHALALQELGAQRVLIKGGHLGDGSEAVDLFLDVELRGARCPRPGRLRTQRNSWLEVVLHVKSYLTAALNDLAGAQDQADVIGVAVVG